MAHNRPLLYSIMITVCCQCAPKRRLLVINCACTLQGPLPPHFPHSPKSHYPPQSPTSRLMSPNQSSSASSNFQLIFDNALKAYKKRTKNDLLQHPLAHRLQACDSSSSVLALLQGQLQELNESQCSNKKWLDPIVNVLHAFSETVGKGVGSVCFQT